MNSAVPMQSIYGCSSQSDPNREIKSVFKYFFPHPIFSLLIQDFCLNADILKYVLFKKKCYEPIRVFEFYLKYEY